VWGFVLVLKLSAALVSSWMQIADADGDMQMPISRIVMMTMMMMGYWHWLIGIA
jgi:hypothetical protein